MLIYSAIIKKQIKITPSFQGPGLSRNGKTLFNNWTVQKDLNNQGPLLSFSPFNNPIIPPPPLFVIRRRSFSSMPPGCANVADGWRRTDVTTFDTLSVFISVRQYGKWPLIFTQVLKAVSRGVGKIIISAFLLSKTEWFCSAFYIQQRYILQWPWTFQNF